MQEHTEGQQRRTMTKRLFDGFEDCMHVKAAHNLDKDESWEGGPHRQRLFCRIGKASGKDSSIPSHSCPKHHQAKFPFDIYMGGKKLT